MPFVFKLNFITSERMSAIVLSLCLQLAIKHDLLFSLSSILCFLLNDEWQW